MTTGRYQFMDQVDNEKPFLVLTLDTYTQAEFQMKYFYNLVGQDEVYRTGQWKMYIVDTKTGETVLSLLDLIDSEKRN